MGMNGGENFAEDESIISSKRPEQTGCCLLGGVDHKA